MTTAEALWTERNLRGRGIAPWYAGAVVVGSLLIVWAAINQPFNQNELAQIAPYGSDSIAEITSGTRQPPLDPLLGAVFQHLLGEGQIQQRLVPVLSGIGTLVVMSLLLTRLRLGAAGAFGLWVLATAPLMVRYSAYTRPYALPMFLMVLFVYAAHRWVDGRRRGWLALTALAAAALPLARVPEPTIFLLSVPLSLAWFACRRRVSWRQAWPLIAICGGALALVGYPMYRALAAEASGIFETSPSGVVERLDEGVAELATGFLPLLGSWMPWWPVTVAVVALALAVPASRRQLLQSWFFLPLLAAPVGFALAYHFLSTVSFEALPYRSRAAYFFAVPHTLVVAALASLVSQVEAVSRRLRLAVALLLGGALLGQLPLTVSALVLDDAPDFGRAAAVLASKVPAEGVVLYDRPSPVPQARMAFLAKSRYVKDGPVPVEVRDLARRPRLARLDGPVYVLINGQCARPGVVCPLSASIWDERVAGWRIASRFDRFTLYEPAAGQAGREGAIEALRSFGRALGPRLGYVEAFSAAGLLELRGRSDQGRAVIQRMYEEAEPQVAAQIRETARNRRLDPFR